MVFYFLVGYIAALSAVGAFLLLVIPYPALIARVIESLRDEISARSSLRVGLISEVLSAIKIIKLYAWESSFLKLVHIHHLFVRENGIGARIGFGVRIES